MEITKCNGETCPDFIKSKCGRYDEDDDDLNVEKIISPIVKEDGKYKCELFFGNYQEFLLQYLKDICSGNKK